LLRFEYHVNFSVRIIPKFQPKTL